MFILYLGSRTFSQSIYKIVFHYFLGNWRENADMSNVKEEYNSSRRKRKGYNKRLNHFVLMRPLRTITKVMADEFIIESPK